MTQNTAPKKAVAKKSAKNEKSFEESLWETATKLRGSVEPSEYKHVVLTNGSMSTNTKGESKIRQKLVENDLVDYVENQAYPLAA